MADRVAQAFSTTSRVLPCRFGRFAAVYALLAAALLLPACQEGEDAASTPRDAGERQVQRSEAGRPTRDASATEEEEPDGADSAATEKRADMPPLCERDRSDAVRDLFCAEEPPRIAGLLDLQRQLGIAVPRPDEPPPAGTAAPGSGLRGLAFLGHSTALSGQLVSPINPRALLLGRETVLAFQRGVQAVEIASVDREREELNFYLIEFEQACTTRAGGCAPGDLYTPRIESDWTRIHIRDDEELKNTASDCRMCHQRARKSPMLLMRELVGPWSHFFGSEPDSAWEANYGDAGAEENGAGESYGTVSSGEDLVAAYRRAKNFEDYAAVPSKVLGQSAGFFLQSVVPSDQPLEFDSPTIQQERAPVAAVADAGVDAGQRVEVDGGAPIILGRSATWDRAYEGFKRGEHLALPHFAEDPTDPVKLARLSEAYRRYAANELKAEQLPDFADVFPDDPQVRAEIGLQTEPGATPAEALVQACGACHNDVLDQSITRARFNIDLSRMDRAERELAIERIERSKSHDGVMPPPNARQLGDDVRAKLVEYLRQETRSPADDALLGNAAKLGMAGNAGAGSMSSAFLPGAVGGGR